MEGVAMAAAVEETNLIAFGARGDEERRRRHGVKTTFVRVFEVHVDAVPAAMPTGVTAGEVRIVGTPASIAAAIAAVKAAISAAGRVPVTAFSLGDLFDLGGGSIAGVADVA